MPINTSELTAQQQATAVYVAYYDRAPDPAGLEFWTNQLEGGRSLEQVATDFSGAAETQAKFPFFETPDVDSANSFIVSVYSNLFGRAPDEAGQEFWADQLASGSTPVGEIILAILEGAQDEASGGFPDSETITNKIDVGLDWAQSAAAADVGVIAEEIDGELVVNDQAAFDSATSVLDGVNGTEQSVTDAKAQTDAEIGEETTEIGDGDSPEASLTLTQQADNLEGTDGDDVFTAPVTQNETGSGQLANTFETGDVLDGGEGVNTLNATLIDSSSVSFASAPIAAQTDNIQNVFLTAQDPNFDNTIDAQNMNGVEQWWSDNSRSNITVEDIRSNSADTAFGMRETDPGVGFASFFNAGVLEGGVEIGESAFNFTIRETNALGNELNDITVNGVRFELDGETFELGGADVEAANTWAELETALQAELDGTEGLEELSVAHEGNGQFTVTDPNSGEFVIDPAGTVISSSTTNEEKAASLGAADTIDQPTETNIFLDNAGNGSQGGLMDVGTMSGDRGVEVFNTTVLSDSHITGMQSSNARAAAPDQQFLQEVLIEGDGDLTVGNTDNALGRALGGIPNGVGFTNVRVVDASALNGSLNAGIALNPNAVSRYLDDAEEAVDFQYTGTANDDELNINVSQFVAGDPDFAMQVDTGDGDDLINLTNNSDLEGVSLDGGEGQDVLESASNIGLDDESTPAAFDNIEEVVLTGFGTSADMDALPDVESVTIATTGGNSNILNLEADTTLTISGERQTLGNNSNNDQGFGTITVTDAQSQSQLINLDNTARADGQLQINSLVVNGTGDDEANSDVREVTLNSGGSRNTTNAVSSFAGTSVNTLNLVGTQALGIIIDDMANLNPSADNVLTVNAAGLEGDLTLGIEGSQLDEGEDDILTGTDGDNDTLTFLGALNTETTVDEFENYQFGNAFSPGGDLTDFAEATQTGADAVSGTFDFANTTGGTDNILIANLDGALVLDGLSGGTTVNIGDTSTDENDQGIDEDVTLNGGGSGTINVNITDRIGEDDDLLSFGNTLDISGFATINLDIARQDDAVGGSTHFVNMLVDDQVGIDLDAAAITGGDSAANFVTDAGVGLDALQVDGNTDNLVITGADADENDNLVLLSDLPASLSTIDVSGYSGRVTATLQDSVIEDPNNPGQVISGNDDTVITVREDDVNFTLTELTTDADAAGLGDAASVDFNTTFAFTDAGTEANPSNWVIDNFVTADLANATVANYSILDLEGLGVGAFSELVQVDDGLGNTVISDDSEEWEITLVGVDSADIGPSENYDFA